MNSVGLMGMFKLNRRDIMIVKLSGTDLTKAVV